MSQNFDFISLPAHLTTGSSIMPPQEKPDVFELIRGKCNKIQALPYEITFTIIFQVVTGLTAIERRIISAIQNLKVVWISPFLYQRHQG
jgi:argininosuccinate lyase